MLLSKWVNQKTVVHLHNGMLCNRKKKGTPPTFHNSVDGTREHYAKWNKPDGERQIPHDPNTCMIYKWNLVKKQAKYNQRLKIKIPTDSGQRGVGRGIMREGRGSGKVREHKQTTHGHGQWGYWLWEWQRWGRGEQWGKCWDNCNWTTINLKRVLMLLRVCK